MNEADATIERAEELAERVLPDRTAKKRMAVIVNPYATTVSKRLRELIVHALESRYSVEAIETEKPDHATQLCREAATEGYDVVAVFGGDGTVNEAANGLAGSDTPLTMLPGGSANVFCRTVGIPGDAVDATEHLLHVADRFAPRRVDLGRLDDRYFTFSAGVGLDASVVERVDRHPRLKWRLGPWYYTYSAVTTFNRRYLVRPPRVRVSVAGRAIEGATVIVQNCDPYTFFGDRPVHVNEGCELDDGRLGITVLRRTGPLELPTVGARALSGQRSLVARHRNVESFPGVELCELESIDGRPLPVQVDGDYIGDRERLEVGVLAGGLGVVA